MLREREPEAAEQCLARAERAFERAKLRDAARWYRQAIEHGSGTAETYDMLGLSLALDERLDEAIEAWERAARLAPTNDDVAYRLAAAYRKKGRLDQSERLLRGLLERNPTDGPAAGELAELLATKGQVAEAAEYRRIAERYDRSPEEEVLASVRPDVRARVERLARARSWLEGAFIAVVAAILVGLAQLGDELYPEFQKAHWSWGSLSWVMKVVVAAPALLLAAIAASWWGAKAAMRRVVEAARGRYGSEEVLRAAEDQQLEADMERLRAEHEEEQAAEGIEALGPPWWRVELSGLHLALWLGIPCAVYAFGTADPPPWTMVIAVYTAAGWLLKAGFLSAMRSVHPGRRVALRQRYRWFGTLRGTLFGLVAVPGIVVTLAAILCGLAVLWDSP